MKTSEGELCSKIILEHLTKDYNCIPFSLYARDFEVPQIRNRVLFIGIRKDIGKEPTCPEKINPNNHIPVSSVLLTEKEVNDGYRLCYPNPATEGTGKAHKQGAPEERLSGLTPIKPPKPACLKAPPAELAWEVSPPLNQPKGKLKLPKPTLSAVD